MADEIYREIANRYPETLPEPFDEIYKRLGYDGLCALVDYFSGNKHYMPARRKLFADGLRRHVASKYDGTNRRDLCREYGISKSTFFRYVGKGAAARA